MSFLTSISNPRDLRRIYFGSIDDFSRLPDLTWRHKEIVPRTYHRRQLRCGTWIVEYVGTRNDDGTMIITSYRAAIPVKAGSRPRTT